MTIQVGDRLPDITLYEYLDTPAEGCVLGPNPVQSGAASEGRKVIVFAVPGAFTPTCSEQHAPGYLNAAEALRARGVDEIWCVSVNDAFVMGAWARQLGAQGRVRFLADGSGDFARAVDMTLDLTARGLGVRSDRYALYVDNGVVRDVQREKPGQFGLSSAEAMLARL